MTNERILAKAKIDYQIGYLVGVAEGLRIAGHHEAANGLALSVEVISEGVLRLLAELSQTEAEPEARTTPWLAEEVK